MAKDRPTIKNEEQYEELRDQGMSKEKAARIANDPKADEKGGEAKPHEERTKEQLYEQAKKRISKAGPIGPKNN